MQEFRLSAELKDGIVTLDRDGVQDGGTCPRKACAGKWRIIHCVILNSTALRSPSMVRGTPGWM
jgi:hypothetical protein